MTSQNKDNINFQPAFDKDGVPLMITWSIADVGRWTSEELQLPHYKDCFESNFINGRHLINMNASSLPRIGITDFKDVKFITKKIRALLGIEEPYWNRAISLPPRDPVSHFLERKSHTGKESDGLTYGEHIRYLTRYSTHSTEEEPSY